MCDDVIAVLTNTRVRVITFAPHTTHVFQMLDVMLFGPVKKHAIGLEVLNEEPGTVALIFKLYHDFKQATVQVNTWGAFSAIGLTHDITQDPYGLLFDGAMFRQSHGFVERWERDARLQTLSTRGQRG
jgi:hypothetical protein